MRTLPVIVVESFAVVVAITLLIVAADWVICRALAWRDDARGREALRRELADAREEFITVRAENRGLAQALSRTQGERDRAREAKGVLRRRLRATIAEARGWKGWATSHGWNREECINAPRRLAKAARRARPAPRRESA